MVERADRAPLLMAVRAFYLDIARWAAEEPARWGPWVAPCPIKEAETFDRKRVKRVKARMDQRTRERLPALETFAKAATDHYRHHAARLQALLAVPPGATFTLGDAVYTRTKNGATANARNPHGVLLRFDQAEHRAFWAWATVEFLRHTGARIEEMLETSHHALIQYRLPTTGEILPCCRSPRPKPTRNASCSSAPNSPTSWPPSSAASATPAPAPSRSWPPTTTRNAPGTRWHPCSSSGTAAARTAA
ncbi:hypothetical protein ACFQ10_53760 [Streptomyces indonesiensis]